MKTRQWNFQLKELNRLITITGPYDILFIPVMAHPPLIVRFKTAEYQTKYVIISKKIVEHFIGFVTAKYR